MNFAERILKMSDFCKECSEKLFGEDFRDLASNLRRRGAYVLCEGCGWIVVDHNGKRIEDE